MTPSEPLLTATHCVRSTAVNVRRIVATAIVAASAVLGATTSTAAPELDQLETPLNAREPASRAFLPRRVTIISDSAMAGVRWNGALGGLRGFEVDDRLESCRRLVDRSCRGREGRRPLSAVVEINYLPSPKASDVLIIATGYNDYDSRFATHSRQVLDAAVAKGYRTIVWVSYRENVSYRLPRDTNRAVSNYRNMNTELSALVWSGAYPQLQVWDLNDYTRFAPSWFASDGVHHTRRGSWGVADWISRKMAHISEQPCPMPWSSTSGQEQPCSDPNAVRPARGYPQLDFLYPL